ncbi:MAG: hypothetical protein EZS28_026602 [Streblomastix strix]|uniref:G-patch domain-containing protein n=1 Tax=Streblomastix strix TaxID=222440 RepID=A0A5J4V6S1_9EUKA|nr:MAG: hypothetical protein EZS28_026602 [Streblomastix strix]
MAVDVLSSTRNASWLKSKGYGYQMLIKMGWREGQGIGKNPGNISHIFIPSKQDLKGIGTKNSKDAWQTPTFNSILARLNERQSSQSPLPSPASSPIQERIVSRPGNHKKLKSKDTSKYSAEDMSIIFGRVPSSSPTLSQSPPLTQSPEISLNINACQDREELDTNKEEIGDTIIIKKKKKRKRSEIDEQQQEKQDDQQHCDNEYDLEYVKNDKKNEDGTHKRKRRRQQE